MVTELDIRLLLGGVCVVVAVCGGHDDDVCAVRGPTLSLEALPPVVC